MVSSVCQLVIPSVSPEERLKRPVRALDTLLMKIQRAVRARHARFGLDARHSSVMQDVFVRLLENPRTRAQLETDPAALVRLVDQVVYQLLVDRWRADRRGSALIDPDLPSVAASPSTLLDLWSREMELDSLSQELPDALEACLRRYVDGAATARQRQTRARRVAIFQQVELDGDTNRAAARAHGISEPVAATDRLQVRTYLKGHLRSLLGLDGLV